MNVCRLRSIAKSTKPPTHFITRQNSECLVYSQPLLTHTHKDFEVGATNILEFTVSFMCMIVVPLIHTNCLWSMEKQILNSVCSSHKKLIQQLTLNNLPSISSFKAESFGWFTNNMPQYYWMFVMIIGVINMVLFLATSLWVSAVTLLLTDQICSMLMHDTCDKATFFNLYFTYINIVMTRYCAAQIKTQFALVEKLF